MFKQLEGDTAVIKHGGIYKKADLYEWKGDLFLSFGGGYIRVYADGKTTKDGVFVEHMETDAPLYKDRFGRISFDSRDGYKPLMLNDNGELLAIEDKGAE